MRTSSCPGLSGDRPTCSFRTILTNLLIWLKPVPRTLYLYRTEDFKVASWGSIGLSRVLYPQKQIILFSLCDIF